MSEAKRDYEVDRGKPHSRFRKSQSGNPRGPRPKSLPALLVDALNEKVVATIDGQRREIAQREAVVTHLVNKSTGADLRVTKILVDMLKDAEKKAGMIPPPEAAPFTAADEEVMANFENGFVHLSKEAPWLAQYLHELTALPNGKHDDQIRRALRSGGDRADARLVQAIHVECGDFRLLPGVRREAAQFAAGQTRTVIDVVPILRRWWPRGGNATA